MKRVFAALVAVLAVGTAGYVLVEKMQLPDALLSAVSVMATVGVPDGLTSAGKLFTTALVIASVSIIVTAVYRFFNPPVEEGEEALSGFFSSTPQSENLVMKELKIGSKSPLAGLQKGQIIQKYGVVVVGIKRKGGFDINVPLTARVKRGSSVLVLGSPATILGVERKRK